jgi:hypothetical protein
MVSASGTPRRRTVLLDQAARALSGLCGDSSILAARDTADVEQVGRLAQQRRIWPTLAPGRISETERRTLVVFGGDPQELAIGG